MKEEILKLASKVENADRYILESDSFYISYNSFCNINPPHDETALVKNDKFYILYGDWRKEYKKLVPEGYMACKKFFTKHKNDHQSFWSN